MFFCDRQTRRQSRRLLQKYCRMLLTGTNLHPISAIAVRQRRVIYILNKAPRPAPVQHQLQESCKAVSALGEPWREVQEYPASENGHCVGSALVLITKPPLQRGHGTGTRAREMLAGLSSARLSPRAVASVQADAPAWPTAVLVLTEPVSDLNVARGVAQQGGTLPAPFAGTIPAHLHHLRGEHAAHLS